MNNIVRCISRILPSWKISGLIGLIHSLDSRTFVRVKHLSPKKLLARLWERA